MEDSLQGPVHDLDDAEHHKEVQQHGETAAGGVIAEILLQAGELLLLLFGLVLVLFLDLHDHRLECRHPGHVLLLVDGQGDTQQPDQDGEDNDVPAVVRDQVVDPLHDIAQRPAKDVEKIHTRFHSALPVSAGLNYF